MDNIQVKVLSSQPAFTCLELAIERLELGVKYVQSYLLVLVFSVILMRLLFEHISQLVLVFL